MNEFEPCPFCGKSVDLNDPDTLYPSGIYWRFNDELGCRTYHGFKEHLETDGVCLILHCSVQAGGCGAEMPGDSVEEIHDAWNRRTK